MKIGIMTVNNFDFHPNSRFRAEAEKKGHKILLIDPYGMGCVLDQTIGPAIFMDKDERLPDLVMPRQGSPMGEYGFVLLGQFAALGIPLVNSLEGVMIARNQYISLQQLLRAGLPIPKSFFVTCKSMFFKSIERLGGFPVVAKQVDGMGGDGVAMLTCDQDAADFMASNFLAQKGVVVQSFIDHVKALRVLVTGNTIAAAMALTPAPGEFKANIHQQASACEFDLPESMAKIAVAAARACSLEIAGVDMILTPDHGVKVLEVNYSPGFRGLEGATRKNIAGQILDHVLSLTETPDLP
ncbi:MAG: RimK family alpha-L-glutamate ligase [Desulfobacter sp.]|nr:MAG: RimK family alpha-L-glutamate ligase [Desulfobacter sp.]